MGPFAWSNHFFTPPLSAGSLLPLPNEADSSRPNLEGFSSSFPLPNLANSPSLQFTTIFSLAFPLCHPFTTLHAERVDKCSLSFQLWGVLFWCCGRSWGLFTQSRAPTGHSRPPPGKGQLPRWTGHLFPGARRGDFTPKQRIEANPDGQPLQRPENPSWGRGRLPPPPSNFKIV